MAAAVALVDVLDGYATGKIALAVIAYNPHLGVLAISRAHQIHHGFRQ